MIWILKVDRVKNQGQTLLLILLENTLYFWGQGFVLFYCNIKLYILYLYIQCLKTSHFFDEMSRFEFLLLLPCNKHYCRKQGNSLRGIVVWLGTEYKAQNSPIDNSFCNNVTLFQLLQLFNFYKQCWPFSETVFGRKLYIKIFWNSNNFVSL